MLPDVNICVFPGPKGVLNDWRKYKQLETEQRAEQKKEMEQLIKKLSLTCRSHLDDEQEKQKQKELQDKINGKVNALFTYMTERTDSRHLHKIN